LTHRAMGIRSSSLGASRTGAGLGLIIREREPRSSIASPTSALRVAGSGTCTGDPTTESSTHPAPRVFGSAANQGDSPGLRPAASQRICVSSHSRNHGTTRPPAFDTRLLMRSAFLCPSGSLGLENPRHHFGLDLSVHRNQLRVVSNLAVGHRVGVRPICEDQRRSQRRRETALRSVRQGSQPPARRFR